MEPLISFRGADLSEANLAKVNLSHINFEGVSLRNANLRQANLRQANLKNASLKGADLRGADLTDTNLDGADLTDILIDNKTCINRKYLEPHYNLANNMKIRDRIKIGTIFSKNLLGKEFVVINVYFDCGGNIMIVSYVKCGKEGSRLLVVHDMLDEQIENINIVEY